MTTCTSNKCKENFDFNFYELLFNSYLRTNSIDFGYLRISELKHRHNSIDANMNVLRVHLKQWEVKEFRVDSLSEKWMVTPFTCV